MDNIFKKIIGFDWDKGNIDKNWEKHKVTSKEVEDVFKDEYLLFGGDEKHSTVESRYKVLGVVKNKRY
jgi:uncharacterized DUF497 family protein